MNQKCLPLERVSKNVEGVQGLCVLIYKAPNATLRVLLLLIDD